MFKPSTIIFILATLLLPAVAVSQEANYKPKIKSNDIKNKTIKSKDIKNGTIKSRDIKNKSIKNKDIKKNTIKSNRIKDGKIKKRDLHIKAKPGEIVSSAIGEGTTEHTASELGEVIRSVKLDIPSSGAVLAEAVVTVQSLTPNDVQVQCKIDDIDQRRVQLAKDLAQGVRIEGDFNYNSIKVSRVFNYRNSGNKEIYFICWVARGLISIYSPILYALFIPDPQSVVEEPVNFEKNEEKYFSSAER